MLMVMILFPSCLPLHSSSPTICSMPLTVYVLPEPVCPYANSVPTPPFQASGSNGSTSPLYTSSVDASARYSLSTANSDDYIRSANGEQNFVFGFAWIDRLTINLWSPTGLMVAFISCTSTTFSVPRRGRTPAA
jgi:hypothetical protein